MSFRTKLKHLQPHLQNEKGKEEKPLFKKQVEASAKLEIPFLDVWEKENVKPYFYDEQYCFIREKEIPIEEPYGRYSFSQFIEAVEAWNSSTSNHPLSAKGFRPSDLFFFDTETTGLGGGAGNSIFLLGYASLQGDKIVLRQHLLPQPGAEIPLYQSFLEKIDYTTLVTYNGKAFDWPQVKTRHTLIREHVPRLPSFGHFDLFHAARRLWKHKLDRLKLSIVEKEVLGIERIDDIPGFLAPMIYFDFVESKKPDGILGIMKHNEMDILSLITLYTHLTFQLLNIDEQRTVKEGFEVGRWYAALGETTAATEILSEIAEGEHIDALEAKYALSMQLKKQQEWERAIVLWEELVLSDSSQMAYDACTELAKYFEHRAKNIAQALSYSEQALLILKASKLPPSDQKLAEINKRLFRLKRKLKSH